MRYTFRHYYIRENMMESLTRYITHGCPVGDFLTAVLANDLADAVIVFRRYDEISDFEHGRRPVVGSIVA